MTEELSFSVSVSLICIIVTSSGVHIACCVMDTTGLSSERKISCPYQELNNISLVDIWLAVHHSTTFLLLPTWYTNFLFIHTNYIKLNSSTCFERNLLIIRRSTMQIVHMQPLVTSLSASDRLVQPLVYQVGNNKKVVLWCTTNQISRSDVSTFLLLPIWYTNFLFIHTNYIKLNSSTCFERNPLIIRRSTT